MDYQRRTEFRGAIVSQYPAVTICNECNEPNGHKCGCSVGIERAAHLMTSFHQGQYRAWELLEAEGIHLDDIAAGQKIANERMEEHRLNYIARGTAHPPQLPDFAADNRSLRERVAQYDAEVTADERGFATPEERKAFIASLMGGLRSLCV